MLSRRQFICTIPALTAAARLGAGAPQLQKVTINFPTRSGASWPLFIAKEGNYKYGLDVSLVFGAHPTGIAMVVGGEAQMSSYSLESVMQAAARDNSFVVVGNSIRISP
jgi:hypothetical protein